MCRARAPGTYRPVDDRQICGQAQAVNVTESVARDSSELRRIAEGEVQCVKVSKAVPSENLGPDVMWCVPLDPPRAAHGSRSDGWPGAFMLSWGVLILFQREHAKSIEWGTRASPPWPWSTSCTRPKAFAAPPTARRGREPAKVAKPPLQSPRTRILSVWQCGRSLSVQPTLDMSSALVDKSG